MGRWIDTAAVHMEEVKLWMQVCLLESRSWLNIYVKPEERLLFVILAEGPLWFLPPTWQLTIFCNSSSTVSNVLFWTPRASDTHIMHLYTSKHTYI